MRAREIAHIKRDNNRLVRPFAWGLEFISDHRNGADPRAVFREHTAQAMARSQDFYALPEIDDWQLAGDQLYVDLDLSEDNLPAGTQLAIGSAVIEVTAVPHTGCAKFVERFGLDAMKFVNAPEHKLMHLRGINTRVVRPGVIRVGDRATKKT